MATEHEDFHIAVTADIDEAGRNFEQLNRIIAATAERGTERLRFLDRVVAGMAGTANMLVARYNLLAGGAMTMLRSLQDTSRQAEDLLETTSGIVERDIGGPIEEKFDRFKLALTELRAAVVAIFWGGISGGDSDLSRLLQRLIDQAESAARTMNAVIEYQLLLQQRSDTAVRAEIQRLQALQQDLQRRATEAESGNIITRMFGSPAELRASAIAVAAQIVRLQQELAARAKRGETVGHVRIDEIDKQIEALKRRNLELRLEVETFGMGAEAAARYRLEQMAMFAAGERWATMNTRQRAQLREQIALNMRLNAVLRDRRDTERADRLVNAADMEIERLNAQARALTMTAGEAARLSFIERERIKFRQAGIPISEADNVVMQAQGAAIARTTELVIGLKRQMQQLQDVGRLFSSSMERAFTDWLSGAETSWKKTFNTFARDMAMLVLRANVLQPLFGGGGIPGGGAFGDVLKGLLPFGGGKAEGGPVVPGMGYLVGERGPELFMPDTAGTVVPNNGGGTTTITMRVDLAGANGDETIARIAKHYAALGAREAIAATNAGLGARQRQLRMLES